MQNLNAAKMQWLEDMCASKIKAGRTLMNALGPKKFMDYEPEECLNMEYELRVAFFRYYYFHPSLATEAQYLLAHTHNTKI